MINTILSNNNLYDYPILISCGIIFSCTLYYIIKGNYTAIPSKNKEPLTIQEIEAIFNENAVTNINNKNIDAIIDNDTDTDVDSIFENESVLGSATYSDLDDVLEDQILYYFKDLDVSKLDFSGEFIMPDVDFNVCPIEELKLFELSSLFSNELAEHSISEEDLMEIICLFNQTELATN